MDNTGAPFTKIRTELDLSIPLIPSFIYFYYLYFPWMLTVILMLNDRKKLYEALISFTILDTTAIFTFIWFPTKMIRPDIIGPGLTNDLIRGMYEVDAGYNLFPSLHVGHSVLVAICFYYYQRKLFPIALVISTLISLSTVFVKQHYVIDIPFGIIYALLAWMIGVRIAERYLKGSEMNYELR